MPNISCNLPNIAYWHSVRIPDESPSKPLENTAFSRGFSFWVHTLVHVLISGTQYRELIS